MMLLAVLFGIMTGSADDSYNYVVCIIAGKNISNHILITQDIYYCISVPECYSFGTYMKLQIAACEIRFA